MNRIWKVLLAMCAALLLNGCALRTVEEMYCLPKRSEQFSLLQSAIDLAMTDMEYSAPVAGENQQTVQVADLDGDGVEEYILFAKANSEKPLQILVFSRQEEEYILRWVMESRGAAFEQVEYAEIDEKPGLEMVVGKRVSDQVLRALSVYTFSSGAPEQLMSSNYYKFLTCDLDQRNNTELMLIHPGQAEGDKGLVMLYSFDNGEMVRSRECELSQPADNIKRIMVSELYSGQSAVYIASSVEESAIITDIFAMKYGEFTNISLSNESGTSVQTMRNYYVYADDVDNDGVLDLPDLINMQPISESSSVTQQYLIRWYSMDLYGNETDRLHTFHNFVGGWYLELDSLWAERVSVIQKNGVYKFYVWNEDFSSASHVFSIFTLTGADREEAAVKDGGFVLYRTDTVLYAARLEDSARKYDIFQDDLSPYFNLIRQDWKTGET